MEFVCSEMLVRFHSVSESYNNDNNNSVKVCIGESVMLQYWAQLFKASLA